MRISARTDYALRALTEMVGQGVPMNTDAVARAQGIPRAYVAAILGDLRRSGLVVSVRGNGGGYLVRSPDQLTVADVMQAVDGPLVTIRDEFPEQLAYRGDAQQLQVVWIAVRAAISSVLDSVTIAQIVKGEIPLNVQAWVDEAALQRSPR